MTLIRLALIPFWQGVPPDEFRSWFRQYGRRMGAVMIPLGITATASTVAAAVLEPARGSTVSALATVGVVAITVSVNEPANERFWSEAPMTDEETAQQLARWARWHDVRVALGVVAVLAAVRRLAR
jgi:uncharacterized membrane protein